MFFLVKNSLFDLNLSSRYRSLLLWLLITIIVNLDKSLAWFENCDHRIQLQSNGSTYINSPYYPGRYPAGSSCRYSIFAPLDHEINIQCNLNIDKTSSDCTSDLMYISRDGDPELRGSEFFCGEGYIQRKSSFNKLILAYTSSTNRYAGQFSCLVTAAPQPCDCGWSMQMRITGGVQTRIHEYPFMSALLHVPSNRIFCGTIIISHFYLLTAAHCLYVHGIASELSVVVGDHDLRTGAETPHTRVHRVSYLKVHENYRPNNGDYNDIALVRVATPMEWSQGVGPACLPFLYTYAQFDNTNGDLVGWGTTSFAGPPSSVLMKATVRIISNANCRIAYPNLANSQICNYSPPKDSCQYDSGGPLVVRLNRLFAVGLISYGMACGTNTPAVNTRITSYLNWIQTNTRENFCRRS